MTSPANGKNVICGFVQPSSELDVLDRGALVAGAEAAHLLEHRAANGTAAAPEGCRLLAAVLVDEMVEQVLVLRQHVDGRGFRVVGAEDGVQIRILVERVVQRLEGVGANADVGIDEEQILSAGVLGAAISGPR